MSLTQVYLGLGSNIEREAHLRAALDSLKQVFGELSCSPVFESEAVGICSDCFLNMVVGLKTNMSVAELVSCLKQIERCHGRDATNRISLPLDIDLLLYGQQVGCCEGVSLPREEILHNAFVLWPLALLAPQGVHPEQQQCFAQLWQQMQNHQNLWPYAMSWNEQPLTPPQLLVQAGLSKSAAV